MSIKEIDEFEEHPRSDSDPADVAFSPRRGADCLVQQLTDETSGVDRRLHAQTDAGGENQVENHGRVSHTSETLTRALWAGVAIVQVPANCRYFARSQRVSHLKPVQDGIKSFLMHFALTVRQVFPWPHAGLQPAESTAGAPRLRSSPVVEVWKSVDPFETRDHFEQLLVAAALGIGAFVSNMPLGGWQVPLAVYIAFERTSTSCPPSGVFALLQLRCSFLG